jgi:hypothetical protein|tara:strand:+ start:940 stop:1281 length:342 start_codon:yes stop_codon:yes gene_type:complete
MNKYAAIADTDGDENISVTDSATTLTLPSIFAAADRQTKGVTGGRATIRVYKAPILFTRTGTAPTAADLSTGTPLWIGEVLVLTAFKDMDNLNMVRATGVNGAVYVYYERQVN